jgi:hypothetical protein
VIYLGYNIVLDWGLGIFRYKSFTELFQLLHANNMNLFAALEIVAVHQDIWALGFLAVYCTVH